VGETLIARIREPAGEPEGALVLFHGRGADEFDLEPFSTRSIPSGG
jgi:predicted esterase